MRNEGQGRTLSNYEKDYLTNEIIAEQERTIAPWVNYLSDKDCPYPTWFKVYAFDGLSRMGLYNDNTKEFEKRDKHTVGRFPNLNPEILAKVYSHINDFFSQDSSAWFEKHPEDEKLSVLVKSGNFNKLYSKELLDTKVIMKAPERTEDVQGDWFEYKLGDEEQISRLAEGTRWCIADPHTANSYLNWSTYDDNGAEEDDYDYDEYEDYDDRNDDDDDHNNDNYKDNNHDDNKARFFIFRLKTDQSKDGYADNGSASIRLSPDGNVAEVSGLNDGQAIEDALVPIVQEKVLSLPGGEKYNQSFKDKQELIRLDKKMQENQDLTKEELEFIYEIKRDIVTLDTYNNDDPRIQELRDKYNIQYILDHDIEIDFNKVVKRMDLDPSDISRNLDALINHGVDANILVMRMDSSGISRNLDTLINHGADTNILSGNMNPSDIADNLDAFINYGADANVLVERMGTSNIVKNLDALINHGADADRLVKRMDPSDIVKNLDTLIDHGADIDVNELVKIMDSSGISRNLDTLINHGADANILVKEMHPFDIADNLDALINHGADVNSLVERMYSSGISRNLDTLINHGADANILIERMDFGDIAENLDTLINHGADIDVNELVEGMNPSDISRNLDTLINHGADIDVNELVKNMFSFDIPRSLDTLINHGADVNTIVSEMSPIDIAKNREKLLAYGANLTD